MWGEITADTRIIDLTVGQLRTILRQQQEEEPNHVVQEIKAPERRLEYGIEGIERIFKCCHTTACRIKKSGEIDEAISQVGRKIVIDVDMALKLRKR